jgi:hypothetical protein
VFAAAGWEVALHDADPQAGEMALGSVTEGLADLARHGLIGGVCAEMIWRPASRL